MTPTAAPEINSIPTPRKTSQQQTILIFSAVIYTIVLISNFYIHRHLSGSHVLDEGLVADFFANGAGERTRDRHQQQDELLSKPSHPLGKLYDGNTITSILLKQEQSSKDASTPIHLRFKPGTLNLTSQQTLSYCYSDTAIYKKHFPSSSRLVTSISDTHMLIYIMLPKSASSSARWIMDNVLEASDTPLSGLGNELNPGGEYENYTTLTFVRDPLSRFYSSYDEVFLRFGPWMKKRKGKFFQRYQEFEHPYPYLYANMTDLDDYHDAFCPKSLGFGKKKCLQGDTNENGTLATRFERFVWDYDGVSPFDLVRKKLCLLCGCYGIMHLRNLITLLIFNVPASSSTGPASFKSPYWEGKTNCK